MKITLTQTEAQAILNTHFADKMGQTVEVILTTDAGKPTQTRYAIIDAIESLRYTNDQKITAIKTLRELTSIGLAEAKFAIESWPTWKAHLLATGEYASYSCPR